MARIDKTLLEARNRNVPQKNRVIANVAIPVSNCCRAIGSADNDVSPAEGKNVRLKTRLGHLLALDSPVIATSLKIANLRLKCSEAIVILSASCLGSL